MAITKLWAVSGDLHKSLGKVVDYAVDEKKTVAKYQDDELQALRDVMDYATNTAKTDVQKYVTGVNCDPACAREQMIMTKERFDKLDGRCAYHAIQSFKPGEVTPEIAHEIGVALAREIWGDRYQVVVATHLDKMHIHNHFAMNSVSYIDGRKFRDSYDDYYRKMRGVSDRLCKEHGLSVITAPQRKGKHYGEWRAEQNDQPTWRGFIRTDVDEAISTASTMMQFVANLKAKGYTIKSGNVKYMAVRPPGKERFVRLHSLGNDYTEEAIIDRIMRRKPISRTPPRDPSLPPPLPERKRGRYKGRFVHFPRRKLKGLRALYFHYLYKLGVLPKKRSSNKRMAFLLREDLYKLNGYIGQMKLLTREHIDTLEQLDAFKDSLVTRIGTLTAKRTAIHKEKRSEPDESIWQSLAGQTDAISQTLKILRRELRWCDEIYANSAAIPERIALAAKQTKELSKPKEKGHARSRIERVADPMR